MIYWSLIYPQLGSGTQKWKSTNHSHTSTCFKVVQFRKESSTDSDLGGPLLWTGLGSYPLHAWYKNTPIRSPNLCSTSQPCDLNLSTHPLSDLTSVLNSYVVNVNTNGLMEFFCFGAHALTLNVIKAWTHNQREPWSQNGRCQWRLKFH